MLQMTHIGSDIQLSEERNNLEALLEEVMTENVSAHEDEMLLKRTTRSLVAAGHGIRR